MFLGQPSYTILFTPPIAEHLDCFCLLVIVINAAIDMGMWNQCFLITTITEHVPFHDQPAFWVSVSHVFCTHWNCSISAKLAGGLVLFWMKAELPKRPLSKVGATLLTLKTWRPALVLCGVFSWTSPSLGVDGMSPANACIRWYFSLRLPLLTAALERFSSCAMCLLIEHILIVDTKPSMRQGSDWWSGSGVFWFKVRIHRPWTIEPCFLCLLWSLEPCFPRNSEKHSQQSWRFKTKQNQNRKRKLSLPPLLLIQNLSHFSQLLILLGLGTLWQDAHCLLVIRN